MTSLVEENKANTTALVRHKGLRGNKFCNVSVDTKIGDDGPYTRKIWVDGVLWIGQNYLFPSNK